MQTRCACSHGPFPRYTAATKRLVTPERLQQAIQRATWHFGFHVDEYKRVFQQHVCRRRHVKPSAVAFCSLTESLGRIRGAQLDMDCTDYYGYTDGLTIHVSGARPMTFEELVGTLLHEEMHCFCKARGKFLGADRDHHCMRVLGERC